MALKRRRLLYVLVAAALLTVWWYNGRPTGSATKISSHSQSDGDQDGEPASRVVRTGSWEHGGTSAFETKSLFSLSSFTPLPSGRLAVIPKVQFTSVQKDPETTKAQRDRLALVKEAFLHSWKGYKDHAWVRDEVAPLTAGHRTTLSGWGATLVDSLDTLWIMGLEQEFNEAVNAAVSIDFSKPAYLPINVFETTIRYLGGFLGAYDVSEGKYPILLEKAREVGDMLYEAFDTPNRLPVTRWSKSGAEVAAGDALVAEIGSLTLEFTRLAQLTQDNKYFDAVQRINNYLSEQQMKTKLPGLFPITVNAREAEFTSNTVFTLGGMTDSLYEYFPKQYLILGGLSDEPKALYQNAIAAIKEALLFRPLTPTNEDIIFAGTVRAGTPPKLELDPQMQHLSCFAGGMFALAAKIFDLEGDMHLAEQITNGCLWAGRVTASGIMPELFHTVPCPGDLKDNCNWDALLWGQDMLRRNTNDDKAGEKQLPMHRRMKLKQDRLRLPLGMSAIASRQYFLRPEVIESVFVMYRITGDEKWREEAWLLFTAITNRARTDVAFAALDDVTVSESRQIDRMESFWLAETLKYFYLIFSEPDLVSLDDYVFNTEAHSFRRPSF